MAVILGFKLTCVSPNWLAASSFVTQLKVQKGIKWSIGPKVHCLDCPLRDEISTLCSTHEVV
jgi:hypothetical protein